MPDSRKFCPPFTIALVCLIKPTACLPLGTLILHTNHCIKRQQNSRSKFLTLSNEIIHADLLPEEFHQLLSLCMLYFSEQIPRLWRRTKSRPLLCCLDRGMAVPPQMHICIFTHWNPSPGFQEQLLVFLQNLPKSGFAELQKGPENTQSWDLGNSLSWHSCSPHLFLYIRQLSLWYADCLTLLQSERYRD